MICFIFFEKEYPKMDTHIAFSLKPATQNKDNTHVTFRTKSTIFPIHVATSLAPTHPNSKSFIKKENQKRKSNDMRRSESQRPNTRRESQTFEIPIALR